VTPAPRPVPADFQPYVWASTAEEVALRRNLSPAQVLRFDANVPARPGVPAVPLGHSFARLNDYPEGTYRELREAAAGYVGVHADRIVVGAGADDLIGLVARTFLAPGRRASVEHPTYPLYAIATGIEGADVVEHGEPADVIWICNPNNPTGTLRDPQELAELARAHPDAVIAVDEAYYEYCGATVAPFVDEVRNLVALRSLSKGFGFAALRVGYAVASPNVARALESRRAPGPVAAPSAKIAAAALRDPRLDVGFEVAERERMCAALSAAGYDCTESHANFVYLRVPDGQALADALEEKGLVVRHFKEAVRITVRLPAENDRILAALGVGADPSPARSALVARTTTETAVRISLDIDGRGRSRTATGVGFLDHLLDQLAFHGDFDLEAVAGGDLAVDEHHTVEDVLAALGCAIGEALGSREGVARYGSATVPMDEARAVAVVDLVRRAHAEVDLVFQGERVGELAVSLLPHALERLAVEGAFTVHLQGRGGDDHHVAEAAFKALGRALRDACARHGVGVRSTKGEA
jgi:histidinol-phosphate aminotransferase